MKLKNLGLRTLMAAVVASLSLAAAVEAGAVDITITGEVTDPTGAFSALTPIGTPVSGPITVNDAALAAGFIGIADISNVAVRVGGFCFASVPDPDNPPVFPCGAEGNPSLVPVESVDQAAITGTSGVLGGTFAITAFSPTFSVSIPISFNLDAGTFFAEGGALGTVAGDAMISAPGVAAPEIETMPAAGTTLAFDDVAVGSAAVSQTITISNTGDVSLTVTSVTVADGLADLVVSDDCMGSVAAAAMCTVTATLTPVTPGPVSATITVASDDADEASLDFPVTANILAAAALSTDATFDSPLMLDSVAVGDTSMGLVTVSNTGGVEAMLGMATAPDTPFALTANDNCSGQLLAGGANCTIEVAFSPDSPPVGSDTFDTNFSIEIASMTLARGGDPTSVTMFVTSSTLDPVATPSVSSLAIADTMVNDSNEGTLVITNSGEADLVISTVSGLVAPFSVMAEDCTTAPVSPTMTCSVAVEFAPLTEGPATGTLSIVSNDPDSPLAVTVAALGTEELLPNITVTPATVNFATPLLIGEMAMDSVTVTNMGTADLALNTISIAPDPSADFSISDDCVSPLVPAASCTITVTFAPASGGPLMATITVDSDDPDSPQTNVVVSGTGVVPEPNIVLSAMMLDLGVESIGNSTMGSVTVSNMGTANLTITSVTIPAGDYTQTNDCEAAPLLTMGACTISITFSPSSDTTITDTLTIVSNDPDSMISTVSLTGRGVLAPEPNISSDVSALDLGNGLFGAILNGSVVISNSGNADLTITGVGIGGADAAEFTAGGDCAGTLVPAANCTATVQFVPGAPEGPKVAVLSIASDDADTPSFDIALSGMSEMPFPVAVFSATSIGFADTTLGDSVSETISVSNSGTGELTVSSIVLSAGAGSAFTISSENCTAVAVAVNGSCDVNVTFAPTTVDDFSDTLTINSDDAAMPVAAIALAGSGTAVPVPDIDVDVASLSFGSVLFGQAGQLTLTVINNGTADLNVASATVVPAGEFSAVTTCGVLMPAAMCTVDVTYTPSVDGDVEAALIIASDDLDMPSLNVPLTGTGVAPQPEIEFSGDSLDFGSLVAGTTSSVDLIISNTGMADLAISSLTVSGVDQALFTQVNDCTSLAMNATCTVTVTYAPAMAGMAMATLTVVSSDADESSVDIELAGIATPVPMPMLSVPATLDIGSVNGGQVGMGAITVSNTGTAELVISEVSLTGANAADFTQTNACMTIAAGESCDIAIEFTPVSIGVAMADVVIVSNDASSPSTVAVMATALIPSPSLSATTLDLGGVRIGESGNATVTITNDGNASLVVVSAVLTGADVTDFTLNNECATVAAGASCLITATFTPQSEGNKMAAITITTNDPTQATVSIPLSAVGAPMEEVVVSVSSEGGNGSFGWLELGGLIFLVGLVRRVRFRAVMMGLAMIATPLALADDHDSASKDNYWYVGGGFGSSDGQADLAAIEQSLEDDAGVSVTSLDIDDTDSGYKLFAGYQATEHLAVEVGYVDLGEADIDLQLGDVALADLPLISRSVSGNVSLLGSGVFGSVVVKQSIGEMFGVFARLGLVSWEVDTAIVGGTSAGNLNIQETESGTDFVYGVGAEAWFGAERKFGLRGEWERYEFAEQDADFLSLGVLYRF